MGANDQLRRFVVQIAAHRPVADAYNLWDGDIAYAARAKDDRQVSAR